MDAQTLIRWTPFVAAVMLTGCASLPPVRAIHIAAGSTSHTICSGVFVSGRGADETYAEEVRPAPGMSLIAWALRYRVDTERREVSTTVAGRFAARAVYRDGYGCLLLRGGETPPNDRAAALPAIAPLLGEIAGPEVVVTKDDRIRAAIDAIFVEAPTGPRHRAKAVVVVHGGQVIAERYAPGIGIHTPLQSHSIAKSVTHALIGILIRDGKLAASGRAPIAEWDRPGDPRREVTTEQLLRMASGLPWDEYAGGWDPSTRMWFIERDKAAFAAQAELDAAPGTRWNYSDAGYMLLSRIVRDATGGSAQAVRAFAHRELFGPLGMQHATIEFDAADTPLGTSHLYASARDWARFGLLYLNDGVLGGRRLLPEGWVKGATTPTLDAGYGSGFWLNTTQAAHELPGHWGMPGAPAEAYFARGVLGQFVVIVPSQQLVVVHLGAADRPGGDIARVGQMVGAIAAALGTQTALASRQLR